MRVYTKTPCFACVCVCVCVQIFTTLIIILRKTFDQSTCQLEMIYGTVLHE